MYAQDGVTYGIIMNDRVVNIFTKDHMSVWNENDLHVVEIPKDKLDRIKVGTRYKHNAFILENYIPTKENILYAYLKDNVVESFFTRESLKAYKDTWHVIEIPQELEKFIDIGSVYDTQTQSFIIDIEKARQIRMSEITNSYNNAIIEIMGENTPMSEMLSWETQEREAKAYLETKDMTQAPSITIMAQTQNRDLEEFANKIIEKAKNYRKFSSFLIGYRQGLIKELETANTIEAILQVQFDRKYVLEFLQGVVIQQSTQSTDSVTNHNVLDKAKESNEDTRQDDISTSTDISTSQEAQSEVSTQSATTQKKTTKKTTKKTATSS